VAVATTFVEHSFPAARAAVLAGSVVAGRATQTSDLDIVVVTDDDKAPWRGSDLVSGWPVEYFVHTQMTMSAFLEKDVRLRRPAMLRMWSEGVLLLDLDGTGSTIRRRARELFARGYLAPRPEELRKLRYQVTDLLADLEGDAAGPESFFIAPTLAFALCHLKLLYVANGYAQDVGP
jgi:Nucleotidyltransferase domain